MEYIKPSYLQGAGKRQLRKAKNKNTGLKKILYVYCYTLNKQVSQKYKYYTHYCYNFLINNINATYVSLLLSEKL